MKHIFVLFILTFTFAGYAFSECSDTDKKALETFDRVWGEAAEKDDRAALMGMLAKDAMTKISRSMCASALPTRLSSATDAGKFGQRKGTHSVNKIPAIR